MTRYEHLIKERDGLVSKANDFRKRNEPDMAKFYHSASLKYQEEINGLTIEEAEKEFRF